MTPTKSQARFAASKERYPAFVGGFGSGKTFAGVLRAISLKSRDPADVGYYLPTYDLVRSIAFPRFTEMLEQFGIEYVLNRADATITTPDYGGLIRFRTMDNPDRIVGYEVGNSVVDELDTLPTDKAQDVWNKIIARNRQKCSVGNSVGVATTPEGFKFVYERWVKNPATGYVLYKAKTRENPYLPEGYVESLEASYPSQLLAAYLDGEFVNLTSGSVYGDFDRHLNGTTATIQVGEPLHIGVDFNIGQMAAVVFVIRDGQPLAVDEITQGFDTPQIIGIIKSRYEGHRVYVYPDASGGSRKSNDASATDLALLRQAGFTVLVNSRNPAVKDRVLSVNNQIHNQGVRRLLVNFDKCPSLVESLEKQAYDKNGEPDKSAGLDHIMDACGYFIAYKFPIVRNTPSRVQLVGI